jgi:glycosyltransferase involved in cell wall biosynthesis
MSKATTVSVVIPTLNRCTLVQETIESALAQSLDEIEIIVVDDGSTDGTGPVLRERYGDRVRYVYQENQGESAARNKAIRHSQGEYIALLDSDDIWLPSKLEKQVWYLKTRPEMGLVSCHVLTVDAQGHPVHTAPLHPEQTSDIVSLESLALRSPVHASTIVVRRACCDEVGGFDERIKYGEDWDFCLRVAVRHQLGFVIEPLVKLRTHPGTQSNLLLSKEVTEHRLSDRLRIIESVFPLLPSEPASVTQLKSRAFCIEYAKAALSSYWHRDCVRARQLLSNAISAVPWSDWVALRLTRLITDYAVLVAKTRSDDAAASFLSCVVRNLPAELDSEPRFKRTLLGSAHIELAFLSFQRQRHSLVPKHSLIGLYHHPSSLRNRGVLSILARSLVISVLGRRSG